MHTFDEIRQRYALTRQDCETLCALLHELTWVTLDEEDIVAASRMGGLLKQLHDVAEDKGLLPEPVRIYRHCGPIVEADIPF